MTREEEMEEIVRRAEERLAVKRAEEKKDEEADAERLRQDYMRRTGRKEMRP